MDIDFIASPGLHSVLKNMKLKDKQAVVVPAFEVFNKNENFVKLSKKNDIVRAWDQNTAEPF